ncbi:unnamed protein product, partial [Sphacelaria rigidula]
MRLAGVTRPNIAISARVLARQSHDSCERRWEGVLEVLAYLKGTRNHAFTFSTGGSVFSVYCDADYAKKETGRQMVSGVAIMYGGVAASSDSRTHHCVTLSTTEAEYMAMAKGAKECMYVCQVDPVFHTT